MTNKDIKQTKTKVLEEEELKDEDLDQVNGGIKIADTNGDDKSLKLKLGDKGFASAGGLGSTR